MLARLPGRIMYLEIKKEFLIRQESQGRKREIKKINQANQ